MTVAGILIMASGLLILALTSVPPVTQRLRGGIFYGWWAIALAATVMILSIVPFFHSMTAWFVVLERQFGWNRTQLSLAFSLSRVEGGIMGPLEGLLIDKLGARRMVIIGTTILGLGFLMFGQIQELWQFYVAFLVMSLGGGLGTWLPMMTVLNSWWVRRRATSMSWVLVGYRLGVVALVPLLTWAIDDSQFGWKAGATGIGVVILMAAIPISRAVRNRPEDYGELPDGVAQAPVTAAAAAGGAEVPSASVDERSFTWQEAIRTKPFWLMSIGHACCTTVIVTIMVHLGPMLVDRGFSLQTVGFVISMYTAIGIGSTLVGGHIGDRIPIRQAIFGFSILQSLGVIVLLTAYTLPTVFLFAILMGLGEGRGSLTTAIRGVYFGRKSFASIMGMSMVPMNALLLIAPLFAGYMFDQTGSYLIPFVSVALVSSTGASLFLFLGDPAKQGARLAASPAAAD
jgi:sugar phosphate permease